MSKQVIPLFCATGCVRTIPILALLGIPLICTSDVVALIHVLRTAPCICPTLREGSSTRAPHMKVH